MKTLCELEKSRNFWYLFLISFLFFIFRFPSLFEPYWYGDEGVYQAVGLALRNGRLLYSQIWDNKPPLLYMLYSIFDSDQFTLKLLSLIFGLVSIFVFYKLAGKILSEKFSLISTALFSLLFGLPILEGNIANAENFMILPTLICALLIINAKRSKISIYLFSGFLVGLSFLFKIVAIFDFAAFFIFISLFSDEKFIERIKNKNYGSYEIKRILFFVVGFVIPILITAMYFLVKGAFIPFINATFLSNIGYVGYGNRFLIPQGLLILKLITLFGAIILLYAKRKAVPSQIIFVYLWFAFSLFNAFFSQRPYTHYLLVLLPSFILLLGILFSYKPLRKLNLIIILATLLIITKIFTAYGKFISYYGNFLSFMEGKEDVSSYQRFFDRLTPIDYELASFIKAGSTKDQIMYTWGNNAQLYKLTSKLPPGRYTVAYHVTSSKNGALETEASLKMNKPKIIIVMPYMNFVPFSLNDYTKTITIEGADVYERVLQ